MNKPISIPATQLQSWIQFLLLLASIIAGIVYQDRRITVLEVKFDQHIEQSK